MAALKLPESYRKLARAARGCLGVDVSTVAAAMRQAAGQTGLEYIGEMVRVMVR